MASTISAGTTSGTALNMSGDTSGVLQLASNGSTTAVTIDTSQNVGIGNTPAYKLDVSGQARVSSGSSASALIATSTSAGGTALNVQNSGTVNMLIGGYNSIVGSGNATDVMLSATQGVLAFGNGASSTERMRIDSSGNLLVGTTSTFNSAILALQSSVANNIAYWKNSNAAPYGFRLNYSTATPNNTDNWFYYADDATALRFKVTSNGGIYNYSANNSNLSDQREKKDIALATNYLDKICQIPVKTFLYNDQTDTDKNLGVIAQDVQSVCPELVMESNWADKDEPEKMRLSIYQTDLQYALMKSIQELKAINDTQAETINALTARVASLEAK